MLLISLFGLAADGTANAESPQSQSIPLASGWNLISVQVGTDSGFTIPQVSAGLSKSNSLVSLWSYDQLVQDWRVYKTDPTNFPAELTNLVPGRGYWIQVNQACALTLAGPVWSGATALAPGWNLVGFAGLNLGVDEQLEFSSIFRTNLSRIPQAWVWEGGTAQRFVGFDTTAQPPIASLAAIEPGQGCWIYSLDSMSLAPAPTIALEADSDIAPLQPEEPFLIPDPAFPGATNLIVDPRFQGSKPELYAGQNVRFAGTNDAAVDLNHNGILDSAYTQDTILFARGVSQQSIAFGNSGYGLIDWAIVSAVPWLAFDSTVGVTGTELDTVRMSLDRSGMLPGFYTNSFAIYAGSLTRVVTAILEVPTIAGDYRGSAIAQRVNGKAIPLGTIDLNLSIFNETDALDETRFRAVINRDKALLFPQDVFMNGIFYQGLDFSMTTSFEMGAGDRNAPPYDSYSHSSSDVQVIGSQTILPDRDYNGNRKLDNENIFPFAIRREVTLLGTRTTADHLEGAYVEAVSGALPGGQRIYIEGTFALDRETLTPTTKSIYSGKTNTVVLIGGSARTSYTNALTVNSDVRIQGAVVTVNLDFPALTNLDITLYSPGRSNAYHFTGAQAGTTLTVTNFNGAIGRGKWEVVVNWNGSTERGYFNGWELRLEGLALYSASGSVAAANAGVTNPLAEASVLLAGGNVLLQLTTDASGRFTFPSLTENIYYLTVSKLGYITATRSFALNSTNVTLAPVVLNPLAVDNPGITAAPFIGQAPLYVDLIPRIPAATLTNLGVSLTNTWDFGDGSSSVSTQGGSVSHFYTNGGSYRARLTVSGSAGRTNLQADYITVLAATPNVAAQPTNNTFLFGGGFIGSLASSSDPSGIQTTNLGYTTNWAGGAPISLAPARAWSAASGPSFQDFYGGYVYSGSEATDPHYVGRTNGGRRYKGFTFFDITGLEAAIASAGKVMLNFQLRSTISQNGDALMNVALEYIGTLADTNIDSTKWSATTIWTLPQPVLQNSSTIGDLVVDVTSLRSSLTVSNRYLVLRWNPTIVSSYSDLGYYLRVTSLVLSNAGTMVITPAIAVYQESKRDSATFDLDRYPYGPLRPELEDTRFFVQAETPYARIGGSVPVPTNQQVRIISALGGCVFAPETAPWTDCSPRVANFKLQVGRIED